MGRKIGRRAESGGWQGRQRRKSGANGDPVCSCAIAGENRGKEGHQKGDMVRMMVQSSKGKEMSETHDKPDHIFPQSKSVCRLLRIM